MKKEITYLDSASTTKIDSRVFSEMVPYFKEQFGNASSNHAFGKLSKNAIEIARNQVADIINCNSKEIIFTSGATEAINLAIKGYTESNLEKGSHIITVKTEHKAVLNTCEYLETKGYEVTYLDVEENGLVTVEQLRNAIQDNTILIAVMYVNNETGVIQPIRKIGELCKDKNIAFFCDASQAVGKVNINIEEDYIDMLCFSGHKLNGPKGVGVLYKRTTIQLTPLLHGGEQEEGLRSGTYNTPLIVGIGKTCKLAKDEFDKNKIKYNTRKKELVKYFEDNNIGKENFKYVEKSPHIISITLNNYEADEYLMLNDKKIIASTGSACNSEVVEISHVLKAIPINNKKNIIRFSIS